MRAQCCKDTPRNSAPLFYRKRCHRKSPDLRFVLEHEFTPLSTIRHFLAPLPPRYFGRWYEIRRAEKEASSKRDRATGCARRPNSPPPARRALLRYRHLPASLASTSDTCDCATSPTTAVYAPMQCNRLRPSEYDAKGCASDAPLSEPDHELTVCIRNVALPTAPTAASASARRGRVFYEMKNAWSVRNRRSALSEATRKRGGGASPCPVPSLYGLRRVAIEACDLSAMAMQSVPVIGQKSTPPLKPSFIFFNYETNDSLVTAK